MKSLKSYVKSITDPVFDTVCDTKLTNGETLTVLRNARKVIDEQIADLKETIERQTGVRRIAKPRTK